MKTIIISILFICSILTVNGQEIIVGSFNIRMDSQTDAIKGDGWKQRGSVVSSLILYHDFDILGAQEVFHNQLGDMLGALPRYGYVGVGRDDGEQKGEYSPIFYKMDRFTPLESGHFWLAEDTTRPNKGWDASYIRICTWALFADKQSGRNLWSFNLHADHLGEQSQLESSKLVLKKIEQMCANDLVVLTGDFNVGETSESYRVISESGVLFDSYDLAQINYVHTGTENYFDANVKTSRRIDHVFVSNGFDVIRYGILTDTYRTEIRMGEHISYIARTPSDHFPVRVGLRYK